MELGLGGLYLGVAQADGIFAGGGGHMRGVAGCLQENI